MAKSKSLGVGRLLGFGSKPKRKAAPAPAPRMSIKRRLFYIALTLLTGSGGFVGANEMELITMAREILRERIHLRLPSRTNPKTDPATAAGEQIRVYFTQPENGGPKSGDIASSLANYIDTARTTIDVCAFELDNQVIIDALVRAVRRKVQVRLVTETDYLHETGVTQLKAVGVPVVDDRRNGSLMHNKFMVFDKQAVWMGSMNFTENCAYRNNNNGLIIDDANIAKNYATKFAWMFEQRKFGSPPKGESIPNPVVRLRDGTQLENYFAPHDQCANQVIAEIGMAKRSIHFMAFSFTHDGIGRAMLSRAANGVEVSGVFEKTQTAAGYSEYNTLRNARLPVYLDGNPRNMHHKVIIIDHEIVITGSFNFSDNADKSNDENLLIIYDRDVAEMFEAEFQKVLKQANP